MESILFGLDYHIFDTIKVDSVKIRLLKLAPPIRMGVMDSAGVEIYRWCGMDMG